MNVRGVCHRKGTGGVCHKLSALERYPLNRGSLQKTAVYYRQVSALERCLHYKGVCPKEVSSLEVFAFERCLPERGVFHWDVSPLMNCWPKKGACLRVVYV